MCAAILPCDLSGVQELMYVRQNAFWCIIWTATLTLDNMVQQISSSRPSVNDLCEALKRRGPDNLNTEVLNVRPIFRSTEPPYQEGRRWSENGVHPDSTASMFKSPATDLKRATGRNHVKLELIGATLQLRGAHPVSQPLRDCHGNLLVYNGAYKFPSLFICFDRCVTVCCGVQTFHIVFSNPKQSLKAHLEVFRQMIARLVLELIFLKWTMY